jgi:hypothetical protein
MNAKRIESVITSTQEQAKIRQCSGRMRRAPFLALALVALLGGGALLIARQQEQEHERIFLTPADAIKSPPEKLAYVVATY